MVPEEEIEDARSSASRSELDGVPVRMDEILRAGREETPVLLVDLEVVRDRYRRLTTALPEATVHYAVRANPAPEVLALLDDLGSSFEVASPGEVGRCLDLGVDPARLCYGSTIKKERDIAAAYERGVRLFAMDSEVELTKIVAVAPGSTVLCRIRVGGDDGLGGDGGDRPSTGASGCDARMAVDLLRRAARGGLEVGVSFHVGPQQRDPGAWDRALAVVADLHAELRASDVEPSVIDLGGGFPAGSVEPVPDITDYGDAIRASLRRRLGDRLPGRVIVESGRFLVGDAGVLQAEVVLVATRSPDAATRWVYLDVGPVGGGAEASGGAVPYRIRTPHDGGPVGPVVIAGPNGDRADARGGQAGYLLPLALRDGDRVELLSTGAYTAVSGRPGWSDGYPPLRTRHLPVR